MFGRATITMGIGPHSSCYWFLIASRDITSYYSVLIITNNSHYNFYPVPNFVFVPVNELLFFLLLVHDNLTDLLEIHKNCTPKWFSRPTKS